jgi:hypothetical integral membrane protein (TIGR02206 family)
VTSFESFGALHLIAVVVLAAAICVLCLAGRALNPLAKHRFELAMAGLIAAFWIGYQVYDNVTQGIGLRNSLPLQLCDIVAIIAALEFARPSRNVHALAYFWGVALSSQALITPDLGGGPDSLGFWAFWVYHLFVVGSGIYAVSVRGFRPKWTDLRFAIVAGLLYAIPVFLLDVLLGLNYGYLGRSNPGQPTVIDLLGPWPMRVVYMVLLAVAAMILFWLPWMANRRSSVINRQSSIP